MTKNIIGKILSTPKGNWVDGTIYDILDSVKYNGSMYTSKKKNNTDIPTVLESWIPGADKGDKGDAFTYEDFTPEQLEGLIGPEGPAGTTNYNELQNKPDLSNVINEVDYNPTTGILTFTTFDGVVKTFDLPIEEIVKSGTYDPDIKSIILVLANDEEISIPVADLVNEYTADEITLELDGTEFKIKQTVIDDIDNNKESISVLESDYSTKTEESNNGIPAIKQDLNVVKVYSKSYQAVGTGKNLFDLNNINPMSQTEVISIFDNRVALAVSAGKYGFRKNFKLKPNSNYTLSCNIEIKLGTIVGQWGWRIQNKTSGDYSIISDKTTYSFTTDSTVDYDVLFYVGVPTTGQIFAELSNIQLEEGITATEWEPYTNGLPSPTSENPSEIKSVADSGTLEIRTRGKNYLRPMSTPASDTSYWKNILTQYSTPKEDGWINIKWDNTSGSSSIYTNFMPNPSILQDIKPNGIYKLVYEIRNKNKCIGTNLLGLTTYSASSTDIWETEVSHINIDLLKEGIFYSNTIKARSDLNQTYALRSFVTIAPNSAIDFELRVSIIDIDTEDLSYEPYIEPSSLSIETEPLREIGYAADIGKVVGNEYVRTENIKHQILTGNENFIAFNKIYGLVSPIKIHVTSTNIINVRSTHFKQASKTGDSGSVLLGQISRNNSTSSPQIFINYDDGVGGVAVFKAWLKEKYDGGNPVIVEYELSTPTVTTTPIENTLVLEQGNNIVETTDELEPIVEATFKASNSLRIDELEKRLQITEDYLMSLVTILRENNIDVNITSYVEELTALGVEPSEYFNEQQDQLRALGIL